MEMNRISRLNLGCCDNLEGGYENVDLFDFSHLVERAQSYHAPQPVGFRQVDLTGPWPWEDSSIDEIRAHDIYEHLPNKIWTMNESYRVLRPGGVLRIIVPTTDGRGAWQDPTHVSYWNPNSFLYYVEPFPEWQRFKAPYGIKCRFRVEGVDGSGDQLRRESWDKIIEGHTNAGQEVMKLKVTLVAMK